MTDTTTETRATGVASTGRAPRDMPRILTFSTLFPNAEQPHHGVFVENRLRHLIAGGGVAARVVAPVPWFPSTAPIFGGYAAFARTPPAETRHGLAVDHPRFVSIPKIGMTLAPTLLYLGALPVLRRIRRQGFDFDLIDAHYFYPDGVAAIMLGHRLGVPVTITARGTDISLIPRHALPRRQILWAASRAAGVITVCQALKDQLVNMGVDAARIRVLRNGVDLETFRPPGDRRAVRAALNLSGRTIVSVGYLIPRKAHDLVIGALPHLPGVELLIAGDGPEEANLRILARSLGVDRRVRFLGRVAHDRLADLYGAADAMVLASSREGWANVLLESMACGTPVVASNVWGTPEVVAAPEAGILVEDRTAESFAGAIGRLLAGPPDRAAVRAYAERFSWDDTTRGQLELFGEITGKRVAAPVP